MLIKRYSYWLAVGMFVAGIVGAWNFRVVPLASGVVLGLGAGLAVWFALFIKNAHRLPGLETFPPHVWKKASWVMLPSAYLALIGLVVLPSTNSFPLSFLVSFAVMVLLAIAQWILIMQYEIRSREKKGEKRNGRD
jgi:glucan phosphoethanolaminetransferase (alkaline phosphatase superfamily)